MEFLHSRPVGNKRKKKKKTQVESKEENDMTVDERFICKQKKKYLTTDEGLNIYTDCERQVSLWREEYCTVPL